MATVSVVLKTHRKKNNGTYPICIRLTEKNKTRYKYIGFSVKLEQFKEGQRDWVRKHPDALYINSIIEDERAKLLEKLIRLRLDKRAIDFDWLLSDSPAEGHTLGEILDIIANRHGDAKNLTSYYRHVSLKKEVMDALGEDPVLNDIKIDKVRKIEAYFKVERGNGGNTMARKIRFLRAAYKEAQLMWPEIGINPFEQITVKGVPVNRQPLTANQIEAIEQLSLIGLMDVVRDAFLLSFYAQGMRFEKVVTLKKDQIFGGVINYRMNKGLHVRRIEIHPKLDRIIQKYWNAETPYLLPLLKREYSDPIAFHHAKNEINAMSNFCLKKIGVLAEVPFDISFHAAKHSYAQMLKLAKVDPWIIKDSLGHTNFNTTEAYLKTLSDDHINTAVTGLY